MCPGQWLWAPEGREYKELSSKASKAPLNSERRTAILAPSSLDTRSPKCSTVWETLEAGSTAHQNINSATSYLLGVKRIFFRWRHFENTNLKNTRLLVTERVICEFLNETVVTQGRSPNSRWDWKALLMEEPTSHPPPYCDRASLTRKTWVLFIVFLTHSRASFKMMEKWVTKAILIGLDWRLL